MRTIITTLVFFVSTLVFGQPTGEENYTNINFSLLNCSKDTISFQKANKKFISTDKIYEITFSVNSIDEESLINVTENVWLTKGYLFSTKYISSLNLVPKDSVLDKKWNFIIRVRKRGKEMVIYYKLYQNNEGVLSTKFKKGNFEVNDRSNSKLVKIKDN